MSKLRPVQKKVKICKVLFLFAIIGYVVFTFRNYFVYDVSPDPEVSLAGVVYTGPDTKRGIIVEADDPDLQTAHHFRYGLPVKIDNKCQPGTMQDLVFLVASNYKNRETRDIIRKTWGAEGRDSIPEKIKTIFYLATNGSEPSIELDKERDAHGDILLGHFMEPPEGPITLIMALQWAADYCSNTRFFVITDDSSYFNTKNLLKYLKGLNADAQKYSYMYKNVSYTERDVCGNIPGLIEPRFLGGNLVTNADVSRDGELGLTTDVYPLDKFCPFISMNCVIMSGTILNQIIYASFHTRYIKFTDAYLGLLALWSRVPLTHVNGILYDFPSNSYKLNTIIAAHKVPSLQELEHQWERQVNRGNA